MVKTGPLSFHELVWSGHSSPRVFIAHSRTFDLDVDLARVGRTLLSVAVDLDVVVDF